MTEEIKERINAKALELYPPTFPNDDDWDSMQQYRDEWIDGALWATEQISPQIKLHEFQEGYRQGVLCKSKAIQMPSKFELRPDTFQKRNQRS